MKMMDTATRDESKMSWSLQEIMEMEIEAVQEDTMTSFNGNQHFPHHYCETFESY